ncbi:MAG TPA: hypothetical protein PLU72_04460 [Candidatus Ozemobacteraceae bacterium]|nr:hypothetical protein [Candidatus Ozemobacteraceae bacterium]
MNMRRGIGSLEIFLLAIFMVMMGSTLVMVWQFSRISVPNAQPGKDLVTAYEHAVDLLANDARRARAMIAGRELLRLESDAESIEWSFSGGNLRRAAGSAAPETVVSGIREGGFTTATPTPGLFSIWMVPADVSAMPLFTSFALRGNGL